MKSLSVFAFLCVFFSSCALLNARTGDDRDPPPGELVRSIPIPRDGDRVLSTDEVRQVVVRSLLNREWGIVQAEGDRVEARLVHRRHEANLTLLVREQEMRIYSDSYRLSRSNERVRRAHPDGWINNIERDLRTNFSRALFDF